MPEARGGFIPAGRRSGPASRALKMAARELAENAALARHLAVWARKRGDEQMARRLDEGAVAEDGAYTQVQSLLDGADPDEPDSEG